MNKERQDKRAEKRFATRQKKAAKDKERQRKEEERKVELAKRIARQSQHMQATYKRFENAMMRCLRWFSVLLDKIIFNRKHAVLISFVLAVLMCISVNASSLRGIATSTLTSSRSVSDVALNLEYNNDAFEVSGAPETVDVTFTGDASAVTAAASSNEGKIVADLSGLSEGTHNVEVKAKDMMTM